MKKLTDLWVVLVMGIMLAACGESGHYVGSDTDTDTDDAGDSDGDTDSQTDADTDTDTDTGDAGDSDGDTDSQTDADTDTDTDTGDAGDNDSDSDTDSESDALYCDPGATLISGECIPCSPGSWDNDSDFSTPCVPHDECPEGTETILGDAVTNTTCIPCVFYVDNALDDYTDHDGSQWHLAYEHVQEGLDAAADNQCQVWVAAGIYKPVTDDADSRTASFQLISGVALYGGFTAGDSVLDDRDIAQNETILSGDIGIVNDDDDNSYHVVLGADDARIDGFTITGGNANSVHPHTSGGGMFNNGTSPTVSNCTFKNNSAGHAGGGMYIYGRAANVTVTNCSFDGNTADYRGGGMDLSGAPTATVTNSVFKNNASEWGGGLSINGTITYTASSTITNCTFVNNAASQGGGGIRNSAADTTITNCILWENNASSFPVFHNTSSSVTVTYSDVEGGCTVASGCTTDETGNISEDPIFVDATTGDFRLQSTSPCIDSGLTSAVSENLDLNGNPRVVNTTVDMGAYEHQ